MPKEKPNINKLIEKFKKSHENKQKAVENLMDKRFKDINLQKER